MARARRRATSVIAALALFAFPCARLTAQSATTPTSTSEAKQAFVASLTQFLEAVAGIFGDEGVRVEAALDSMQTALAAWDAAIGRMEASVRDTGGVEARFALGVAYLNRLRLDEALREFAAANAIDRRHPEVHVLSGVVHTLRGRHASAVEAFATASKLDPDDAAVLYRQAHSLERAGRSQDAEQVFTRFVDLQQRKLAQATALPTGASFARVDLLRQVPGAAPIFPPAPYANGMAAIRDGRYAEAISLLRKAAAADPLMSTGSVAAGRIREGAAALRGGALAAAIEQLTAAVAQDPRSSEAHRLAGMAYWADEQFDRSVEYLQTAILLTPSDDRARVALADVYAAAGKIAEAEQTLREAVKAVPASGVAQYRLGRLLYERPETWADATSAFETALRLQPIIGSDLLYQMLGHMHLLALNADAAVDAAMRRIEVNPNQPEPYRVLGEALVQQGRDLDAIPQFLAALLVEPRDAASWAALAQSQLRTGDYARAVSSARRTLQIDSSHPGAQFALANGLVRLGRVDEGAKELEQFRRLQSAAQAREAREWELKMLNQEASASVQRGQPEQAITALRSVVALAPDDASSRLALGAVLKSAGQYADAIEQFRKALELSADPTACRLLVESYEALGRTEEAERSRDDCIRLKGERVKSGSMRR